MKYKFVKLKRGKEGKADWYFIPQSEEQVIEHFNKIFAAEIRASIHERIENTVIREDGSVYCAHPSTPFARAIQAYSQIYDEHWILSATRLENEVINQRIATFNKGVQMLLDNGVIETRITDTDEILEELEIDSFEYPIESQYRFEDVRYMKWDMPDLEIKGVHWYAKIGNIDISDAKGNMKWNTKTEAEEAAKWFVEQLNYRRYNR